MTSVETAHAVSMATVRMVKLARSLRGHTPMQQEGVDIGSLPLLFAIGSGEYRVSELADLTHSDVSVVSRLVRQFELRGLASKKRDPKDGRAFVIQLTEDGDTFLAKLREERAQWLADLLADWPDRDVDELIRLLNKFSDELDQFLRRSTNGREDALHDICSLDVNKNQKA